MKKLIFLICIIFIILMTFSGCNFIKISDTEDGLNYLQGGPLYTSDAKYTDKEYQTFFKEREKSINTLTKKIDEAYNLSEKVNNGISSYEENLFKYIDKIEDFTLSEEQVIQDIINKMFSYKLMCETFEDEYQFYKDSKPQSDSGIAAKRTLQFNAFVDLYDMQNKYINWLIENTSTVIYILEKDNERQSNKLLSYSASIYNGKIKYQFHEMSFKYTQASEMYLYISTADYHNSLDFLNKLKINIADLENTDILNTEIDSLNEIVSIFEDAAHSPQKYLKTLADVEMRTPLSFNLFTTVHAQNESLPNTEKGILFFQGVDNENDKKYSKESIKTFDIEAKLLSNKNIITSDSNAIEEKLSINDNFNNSTDDSKLKRDMKAMTLSINPIDTTDQNIKNIITKAQEKIRTSLFPYSVQYVFGISKIVDGLLKDNQTLTSEQIQKIRNLFNNDLDIIMNNLTLKGDFMEYLANINVDTLFEQFNSWIEKIDNTNIEVNLNNLGNLLHFLGFDLGGFVITDISDDKENNTNDNNDVINNQVDDNEVDVVNDDAVNNNDVDVIDNTDDNTDNDVDDTAYDITRIIASFDTLKRINASESNDSILMTVFGWEDTLDYSKFEKIISENADGSIYRTYYLYEDEKIGWSVYEYETETLYSYYFPQSEKEKEISITRNKVNGNSLAFYISTSDDINNRNVAISFDDDYEDNDDPYMIRVTEYQNKQKDGLYFYYANDDAKVFIYDKGNIMESYEYDSDILESEKKYFYINDDVYTKASTYYANGNTKVYVERTNYKSDGLQISYYENGNVNLSLNYIMNKIDGERLSYYESGQLKEIQVYTLGIPNGINNGYYSDGTPQFSTNYKDGVVDGNTKSFTKDGIKIYDANFTNGVLNGAYYSQSSPGTSNAIEMNGQYVNGKKEGEFEYNYVGRLVIEISYYENDILIWRAYLMDEKIYKKKFFDSKGNIIKTEQY